MEWIPRCVRPYAATGWLLQNRVSFSNCDSIGTRERERGMLAWLLRSFP